MKPLSRKSLEAQTSKVAPRTNITSIHRVGDAKLAPPISTH